MRILVCNWKDLGHPRAGGAEVWTQGIARAWVAAGHHVVLASSAAPGLPEVDDDHGVRIERGGHPFTSVHAHARQVWHRHRGEFDLVVEAVNTRPFLAHRWAGTARCAAVVFQVAREVWFHELAWPAAVAGRFLLEPRWLRQLRAVPVFTISASSAASLAAYGLRDVAVVPMPATLPPRPAVAKEERFTVVFVGRLQPNKRPDHVVRAFRRVLAALPDAQLWIVGRGPMEAALRRAAADLAAVSFLGHLDEREKAERMARAHALAVTSVREGWGLVVSEAAAVGTHAVAYDVAGLRDSVPAASGILTRPDPDSLADALVANAEMLRRSPGPAGTGTVTWDAAAAHLLEAVTAGRAPARDGERAPRVEVPLVEVQR